MKDFLGDELAVGDYVTFCKPNHRGLTWGQIDRITPTPKRIRIAYNNTWNYGKDGMKLEYTADPREVIRLEGAQLTMLLLKA